MRGEFVVGYVWEYVIVHITNATLEILIDSNTSGSHEPRYFLLPYNLKTS